MYTRLIACLAGEKLGPAAVEGDDYEPVRIGLWERGCPRTHARTHAHARTGTRPGAIGTNGSPDHSWRNLQNWRKFRHWRNCRDCANWHTYVPHAQLAQLPRLAGLTLAIVRTFARPECASLRIFLRPYPQAGGSGALRTTECACANNPK